MTEPGSVFRVKINSAAGQDKMAAALRYGLPVAVGEPVDWQNCPFVPENGYGQIRHNLVSHTELGKNVEFIRGIDV